MVVLLYARCLCDKVYCYSCCNCTYVCVLNRQIRWDALVGCLHPDPPMYTFTCPINNFTVHMHKQATN